MTTGYVTRECPECGLAPRVEPEKADAYFSLWDGNECPRCKDPQPLLTFDVTKFSK
jgi:hypothetical protein